MIKFFKKEKNWEKGKGGSWLNINFYWELAVCLVLLVVLFSFLFGYRFFMRINEEFVLEVNSDNSQVETVKKERIEKVLEYFSLRKQKSSQILNSPAPIVDPSL